MIGECANFHATLKKINFFIDKTREIWFNKKTVCNDILTYQIRR